MKHNSPWTGRPFFTPILTLTFALTSASLLVAQSSSSPASEEHKVCSNRSIMGKYGFQIEGIILGPNLTLRTLSLAHFDGMGNLTSVDYVVLGGTPPAEEWRPATGTYSINPDCTGSVSLAVEAGKPPLNYHLIVVDRGRQILLVVDGAAIRGVGTRIE
jgi:hypothetical protein